MAVQPLHFPTDRLIGPDDRRYNPAMISFGDRTFFAYRTGLEFAGRLFCCELNRTLQPIDGTFGEVTIPDRKFDSLEDPRFFVHSGDLHLYITAYRRFPESATPVIARVGSQYKLQDVRLLKYPGQLAREKNWCPIEHDGRLYATYWMARGIHHVVAIKRDIAAPTHETKYASSWRSGDQRGGTNLVAHDGLLWGFFHSSMVIRDVRVYFMGAYAIERCPPFRIVKMTRRSLYHVQEVEMLETCYGTFWPRQVIFPSGLMFSDGHWIIAAGYNDYKIVTIKIAHRRLESLMENVALPCDCKPECPHPFVTHDPPSTVRTRRRVRRPVRGLSLGVLEKNLMR